MTLLAYAYQKKGEQEMLEDPRKKKQKDNASIKDNIDTNIFNTNMKIKKNIDKM